ncbi:class I SAM-dependent methyltransferase [Pseudoalteromonas sp. XMcav1-K]|uniref:class I SAM-dependent methyltransferase n=1 Tax=Pseudoalteromonas sp. XMcav1-K TaxID=3374372 RepID=UPI003756E35B
MKPALSLQNTIQPHSWYDFPHGEYLKQEIEEIFTPWLNRIFGYHLLKIGELSAELDTSACVIKHQVNVANSSKAGVRAHIDELPFSEQTVDGCILSHGLEYLTDPHHCLREVHRVLMPGGYLVLSGFNPFSFCGLARILPFAKQKLPWSGRFFTPARVKDWLHLLGFEVVFEERAIYSSLARGKRLSRFAAWQSFCQHYLKPTGSVYVIVARKRVAPLTPIKPKWHARPQFNPAVRGVGLRSTPRNASISSKRESS